MNIDAAKGIVIKAGLKLVESGLIARTWGNVSCRISENSFVITPSGRDYLTLTPEEIVIVKISDCSYDGNVKPSSEKGIHAEVYKLYPNINFVIHTHQENASVISATELSSIKLQGTSEYLSNEVLCAAYALPGTKKLRQNVSKALSSTNARAVIMKHHGALCFGENFEETFDTATQLEIACQEFISVKYLEFSGRKALDTYEMANFAISTIKKTGVKVSPYTPVHLYNSRRTLNGFILFNETNNPKEIKVEFDKVTDPLPKEAEIYASLYRSCKAINYILHKNTPEIASVANNGVALKPLLDDFAQIAGTLVKNVEFIPNKITNALKKSSSVLIPGFGALCVGKTKEDAFAVELITQKACKALVGAAILGKVKPINPLEGMLMRFIYLKKYSKQIHNDKR